MKAMFFAAILAVGALYAPTANAIHPMGFCDIPGMHWEGPNCVPDSGPLTPQNQAPTTTDTPKPSCTYPMTFNDNCPH
jgi:hypothetical protein